MYVLDALRADVVGHLGSDLGATPCMDRLAAEGAAFTDHFSVAPNTGPATMSLFTGYGFLRGRAIPEDGPSTLAEAFAVADFKTISISSNPHLAPSFGLTRGFQDVRFVPIDENFGGGVDGEAAVNDSADRVHGAALSWLDAFADRRSRLPVPPHPQPPQSLHTTGALSVALPALRRVEDRRRYQDPRRHSRPRSDRGLGRGRATDSRVVYGRCRLQRRRTVRICRRTRPPIRCDFLLVVTSDHGEELFDHDGVLHGYTLYDELLRVPLIVWWPGQVRPARIERATDTLDLSTALRALVGGRHTGGPDNGTGLWAAINGESDETREPALHFATAPGLRRAAMVRSDRWKVIVAPRPRFEWGMGRGRGRTHDAEYVFNLTGDPGEIVNRAGASSLEVDWLRSRLRGWVAFWEARQPEADDGRPDEATRRRLEALGYTE